jgi:hypothetical protein
VRMKQLIEEYQTTIYRTPGGAQRSAADAARDGELEAARG